MGYGEWLGLKNWDTGLSDTPVAVCTKLSEASDKRVESPLQLSTKQVKIVGPGKGQAGHEYDVDLVVAGRIQTGIQKGLPNAGYGGINLNYEGTLFIGQIPGTPNLGIVTNGQFPAQLSIDPSGSTTFLAKDTGADPRPYQVTIQGRNDALRLEGLEGYMYGARLAFGQKPKDPDKQDVYLQHWVTGGDKRSLAIRADDLLLHVAGNGGVGIGVADQVKAKLHVGGSTVIHGEVKIGTLDGALDKPAITAATNGTLTLKGSGEGRTGGRLAFGESGASVTEPTRGKLTVHAPNGLTLEGNTDVAGELHIDGGLKIRNWEISAVPDYVFDPSYELPDVVETAAYAREHRHLPEIPGAADIHREGLDLGQMTLLLLKKVEELTLHVAQQQQTIRHLEARFERRGPG